MKSAFITILCLCFFCLSAQDIADEKKLFKLLNSGQTGIEHKFGELEHAGLEGGGVAVGDLNGDDLYDIFLVGDSLHGLYENIGNLKFKNRFPESNIPPIRGATSVLIYDINSDGMQDIILGKRPYSNNPLYQLKHQNTKLENEVSNIQIFLNQGDFKFSDSEEFSINMNQAVSGMTLADFDKNGLTDIAISTWDVDFSEISTALLSIEELNVRNESPTRVFMQTKKGHFEDKTFELGINKGSRVKTSFSLTATDLNNDLWPDLIISNDFDIPDMVYLNNGGKSFEMIDIQKSMSFFSMGIDAADITNNGLIDFMISDMRPVGYYRQKTVKYEKLFEWNSMAPHSDISKQQVKNTLFINNGDLHFSEISEMINTDATDWSWSVLLADFDNNQYKDIFIANGYYYQKFFRYDTPLFFDSVRRKWPEMSDIDFLIKLQEIDSVTDPVFKNYFFKNNGNLNFENVSSLWQEEFEMNTRGASYADLDNDGDLDLVLNNSKEKAAIIENKSNEKSAANYLRIKLTDNNNRCLLHSKINIYYSIGGQSKMQMQELQPCRGFYSNSEDILHFGLSKQSRIDSLIVTWPLGKKTLLKDIAANQVLEIQYPSEDKLVTNERKPKNKIYREEKTDGLDFTYLENDFNDFIENPLLPQMFSREGPAVAIADISRNGLDDIVISGAAGKKTSIFYQFEKGKFNIDTSSILKHEYWQEDGAILVFDYDSDGLNDIFIASGGYEKASEDSFYTHRIYRNLGNGKFQKEDILPDINSSASIAKLTYLDDDSSKALIFIGARVEPKKYPATPNSYLITYQNGKFVDVTEELAPELMKIGMVADATWTDFDNDNKADLVVVGEYMSPQFFRNSSGTFNNVSNELLPNENLSGFWNCITPGDFNKDGKTDYILGNLGLNTRYKASEEYPLEIFAADFDDNGYTDVITAYYEKGKLYPVKPLNTLKNRINGFSKKYFKHADFASKDLYSIFDSNTLNNALHLKAHTTASILLQNNGSGKFIIKQLPIPAQIAPIQDALVIESNKQTDILLVGNFYPAESERGAYTASNGLILRVDDNGDLKTMQASETGFSVNGDCRFVKYINKNSNPMILVGRNNDSLKVFSLLKANH